MMMQNENMAYVLDETAILKVLFRVAVKDRKELAPLTDHLTDVITPSGFEVEGYEWNQKANCGIILISYKGDKIHYNAFGEANLYDINCAASFIDEKVSFYCTMRKFAQDHADAALKCLEIERSMAEPIEEVPEDDADPEEETEEEYTPISLY